MLSEREQRVCRLLEARRGAMLEDLRLHVGTPTGTGHAPGLDETRQRLCDRCRALGATVELAPGEPAPDWLHNTPADRPIPPVAVCRRIDSAAARSAVLIAGHLDTVHDPRGSFRELTIAADGRTATGPGCVDMKGGLVIAMAALEALAETGEQLAWTFMLNSDEETGSFHSDAALRREAGNPAYRAAIALEPAMADGGLAVQRGGSGQFLIDAFGKAAHVGRDFGAGRSAVDALARAIVAAHNLSVAPRGVCVNVSPLWCPNPSNMVADRARGWGNARFPTPEAGRELEAALKALGGGTELPRVDVRTAFTRPAKPLTPQVQVLAEMIRRTSEDLGRPLPFGTTAGVCDGNNLQDAGLPTLDTLGVRGGGLHTLAEWIDLESLVDRSQLLALTWMRLAQPGT